MFGRPLFAETVEQFELIETVVIQIFSLEFVCRLASTPDHRAFVRNGMNWIDLGAIVPWYIGLAAGNSAGTGMLRVLRLSRLLRVVRVVDRCEG